MISDTLSGVIRKLSYPDYCRLDRLNNPDIVGLACYFPGFCTHCLAPVKYLSAILYRGAQRIDGDLNAKLGLTDWAVDSNTKTVISLYLNIRWGGYQIITCIQEPLHISAL